MGHRGRADRLDPVSRAGRRVLDGGGSHGNRGGSEGIGVRRRAGSAFDVVIIGGGPGGYATALYGAAAGLSVAVVEMDKVGGTCLHRGCVPAKEFLETAAVYRTVSGSGQFGINAGRDGAGAPPPPSTSRSARPASRRWSTSCSRAWPG